jgi:hypothetical protein
MPEDITMRGSQFAKKANALIVLVRERSPARTWMAAIVASLLVPVALVTAAAWVLGALLTSSPR